MVADTLFHVFIGGCILLTGAFILIRRGRFSSWWMALLVWFSILPIIFSLFHGFLRKAILQNDIPIQAWIYVFAPYVIAIGIALLFFMMRQRRVDPDPTAISQNRNV